MNTLFKNINKNDFLPLFQEFLKTRKDLDEEYPEPVILKRNKKMYIIDGDVHLLTTYMRFMKNDILINKRLVNNTLQSIFIGFMIHVQNEIKDNLKPMSEFNEAALKMYKDLNILVDEKGVLKRHVHFDSMEE